MQRASQPSRRLAAILVADVVGYSALMEADEASTLQEWQRIWTSLIEPEVQGHSGSLVKSTGDGFIAEFRSVVDAVECAAAIQEKLVAQDDPKSLVLRIGINVGDVVADKGDLFGDAVNVAARLEQACEPGGVLISGSVHEQLVGKTRLIFVSVGEQSLKNIGRPIEAFQLVNDSRETTPTIRSGSRDKPVIAVLPFTNMSGDPDRRFFSDGITEDIITDLSRFNEVAVVARNSSFAVRDEAKNMQQVGKKLGADFVLDGSVRPLGSKVRITAQLTEVATGLQRWADRQDCLATELFDFQERISQNIVASVARQVRDQHVEAQKRRPVEDLRAYELILRANRISDDFRPEAQEKVLELYSRALALDPKFARAHSGLAYFYLNLWFDGAVGVPARADANAKKALTLAEEAVALDPNDARCHSTLGFTLIQVQEIQRGARQLDLARRLNPNDPTIMMLWAYAQSCLGNVDAGTEAAALAQRLNPQHPSWYNSFSGRLHFQGGRYHEAITDFSLYQSIGSRRLRVWGWQVAALSLLGRQAEAHAAFEEFHAVLSSLWAAPGKPSEQECISWALMVSCLVAESDRSLLRQGMEVAIAAAP